LNNDGFHMTTPLPSGESCIRAMREALADAQLQPEQIDYINAHASSTQLNDSAETASIKQVFSDHARRIPISGTKGYYAHPLGATGAIEAGLCALSLDRQWIPPTINYQNPDPACDLDVMPNHGRAAACNSGILPDSSSRLPSLHHPRRQRCPRDGQAGCLCYNKSGRFSRVRLIACSLRHFAISA
jgi:3-oxoacyl-(acyl-carrier-protein) synthase